ncbi:MAG: ATP-binding protein [Planctomycetes bacterium]|nr:ATP-binding protein [Planctomycetota bacterium]
MFARWYRQALATKLKRPYVHILFGARQTGKSTLLRSILPADAVSYDLAEPGTRSRLLADPSSFVRECHALPRRRGATFVFVDEAQNVPALFDAVQHLYDGDRSRWRFVLCGSSSRKLRSAGTNLLPGRCLLHRLFPLTTCERPSDPAPATSDHAVVPMRWRSVPVDRFPPADLDTRLVSGELPGIAAAPERDRVDLLRAYAIAHLEEEIRREAFVRDWAAFLRFLVLAARESGQIVNHSAISRDAGISQPTVKSYYQLLEDMFVGFTVPAWSRSPRKSVLSTPRFFLFDVGVRHAAAGLKPSHSTVHAAPGPIFEQWVGIELWKRLQYRGRGGLHYLRTKDGAEVDFVVDDGKSVTPIEVKWSERPTLADARHLRTFLDEHTSTSKRGLIVCRCARPMQLDERVTAIPWWGL